MQRFVRMIPLAVGLALAGCTSLGPRAVEGSRVAYNEVLAQTQDEQLLLNVVRLRYVDVPLFLEVSSVNTQFEFRTSADAGISGTFGNSLSEHSGSAGLGFSVVEKPTVSYVPLQGDAFVKRLMAPVDVDTIVLLTRAGWGSNRVLKICAQSLGGLPNAPAAAGPAPDYTPRFEEFDRVVGLLREQQRARQGGVSRDEEGAYHLRLPADAPTSAELRGLLGLGDGDAFPIRVGSGRDAGAVMIEPRSLLGAMFYLSQAIDVPAEHIERGWATATPGEQWAASMRGLLRIRSAESRPDAAAVAVRYRGRWFYVDESDTSSKSTFALLSFLFSVQSGDRDTRGPALTIGL